MHELITISTGEQGSPVVSARELYTFLEVKSKFADWIKNRIIKYGFLEEEDYVMLSKFLESGGKELDYALTLDMAKQLAMVERNEKGKQARLYFIEAEKRLTQLATSPPSTDQLLIQLISQSNQLMVSQQEMLQQLRADVDNIIGGQRPAKKLPPHLSRKTSRPVDSVRQLINRAVNDYCTVHEATPSETYNYLYKRMYDVYGVNVRRLQRRSGEYILDAIERYGRLNDLYKLVINELPLSDE